jgi:hypothetical protein
VPESTKRSRERDSSTPDPGSASARDLLVRLAVPRLPGSAALTRVESLLIDRLRGLGFAVTATTFTATSAPLDAAGALGAGLGWIALLLVPLLVAPVPGWSVALVTVAAMSTLAVVTRGIERGHLRAARCRGEVRNIEACRGAPRVWLVAHSDSKAQALSLRARVLAVGAITVGAVCLVIGLALRFGDAPFGWLPAMAIPLPLLVGGALLSRGSPTDESSGAVDNASGVIAVLAALEELGDRDDVGVLITGAEEFGMAGARVWSSGVLRAVPFVNFDGIDSRGAYRVMVHRAGADPAVGQALAEGIAAELCEARRPVRVGRLPPGVLVDGVVLARAGMPGVTVSRGDWRTLAVVHTPNDVPDRLDPDAAVQAGRAVAVALRRHLG